MELRPYQIEDINFLSQWANSACFNEQRTGKSIIALKTMQKRGAEKVIIICPASAVLQWKNEVEKWLNEDCIAIIGSNRNIKLAVLDKWKKYAVISYDSFKQTTTSKGLTESILDQNPDGIIIDEAHRIKNDKSAVAQAIFKTKNIKNKMALTGTPASNKAYEIYSILHWLYPEQFKSKWIFYDLFFYKQKTMNKYGKYYINIGGFKSGMEKRLQYILNSFSTQRKRSEIMQWLPEKDYEEVKLPLTDLQKKYLESLEKYFKVGELRVQGVLDRLIRYRQVCLAPELLELKGNSPKKDWILQYIEDYPDTPTIIFSKFTSFIKLLDKELKLKKIKYNIIIGDTTPKNREKIKQDFQNGKLNLLLINIDAGKEALTLDRAEKAIFTDKYPPVGDIQQAEDRFIATTIDKASKPHTIVELMMADSYDEELYKLIKERKSETDVINNYKNYKRKEDT